MASFQLFARHGPGHLGNIGSPAKRGKTRGEGEEEGEEEEDDGKRGRRKQRLLKQAVFIKRGFVSSFNEMLEESWLI